MNIDKIIKSLQIAIASVECAYNKRPDRVILGSQIIKVLTDISMLSQYDHEDEPMTFIGIPMTIDYDNPQRMTVCLEFDVQPMILPILPKETY